MQRLFERQGLIDTLKGQSVHLKGGSLNRQKGLVLRFAIIHMNSVLNFTIPRICSCICFVTFLRRLFWIWCFSHVALIELVTFCLGSDNGFGSILDLDQFWIPFFWFGCTCACPLTCIFLDHHSQALTLEINMVSPQVEPLSSRRYRESKCQCDTFCIKGKAESRVDAAFQPSSMFL